MLWNGQCFAQSCTLGGLFGKPRKYRLSTELFSLTLGEVEMDLLASAVPDMMHWVLET